jgi:hypothetical protein
LGVRDVGAQDELRLYRIDLVTGAATQVGAAPVLAPVDGTDYGMDFNPAVDRVRVVNDGNENLRLNPNNGALAGDDTNLSDAVVPDSRPLEAVAYNLNIPFGVAGTTLFGISPGQDELVTIGGYFAAAPGGPNGGTIGDARPLGVNVVSNVSFDIADTQSAGFLAFGSSFGSVSLATGAFGLIGTLAQPLGGFAVLPATRVTLAERVVAASEAGGRATLTLTRSDISAPTSVRVTTEESLLGASDGDTATPEADYQPLDARVAFVAGEATATVSIPIVADQTGEGEETLTVYLADPGPTSATPTLATVVPVGLGVDTGLGADKATVAITADPGPPPPPVTPPDTTGPFALLIPGATSPRRAALGSGGLAVRFVCGEACRAAFTLSSGKRTLGRASKRLSRAGLGSARVRLTRAGRRALARALQRRRSTRLTLVARFIDAAGNPTVRRSRVTARR